MGSFTPSVLLLTDAPMIAERLQAGGVEVIHGYNCGHRYFHLPFALRGQITTLSPYVLHSHGYDANYFVCWARAIARAPWSGAKLVFTSHGWIDRPSLLLKTTLDLLSHRLADQIIICSPHQFPRAQRAAAHNRITFISNGVPVHRPILSDPSHFRTRFKLSASNRLIGFVGRLSPEKGVHLFVQIAQHLASSFHDVHFLIVGGGPLEAEVIRQISALSLDSRITMTGVISDVDSVYQNIDVLVLPSAAETTSRVTIEAMLWGIPVVASNVGGLSSLIDSDSDGFLCPPGVVMRFVDKIGYLLANCAEREKMGQRALKKARDMFSVGLMRDRVEAVYLAE